MTHLLDKTLDGIVKVQQNVDAVKKGIQHLEIEQGAPFFYAGVGGSILGAASSVDIAYQLGTDLNNALNIEHTLARGAVDVAIAVPLIPGTAALGFGAGTLAGIVAAGAFLLPLEGMKKVKAHLLDEHTPELIRKPLYQRMTELPEQAWNALCQEARIFKGNFQ